MEPHSLHIGDSESSEQTIEDANGNTTEDECVIPSNDVEKGLQDEDRIERSHSVSSEFVKQRPSLDRRKSSLLYRRLPESILLNPETSDDDIGNEVTSLLSDGEKTKSFGFKMEDKVVRRCFLNPTHTFRRQMMTSFGILNISVIVIVVAICVVMAQRIGIQTNVFLRESLESQVEDILHTNTIYLNDAFNEGLLMADTIHLIHDVIVDRFDGYLNASTDEGAPFLDMNSQTNIYPIRANPMPMWWDLEPNVNEDNYEEFIPGRELVQSYSMDTTNAGFQIQGSCDPTVTDPTSPTFVPNCTDASNDIRAGGSYAPSENSEIYHRKGSDLVPIFRSLFEHREGIREIYVHFLNDGAGASLTYPQFISNNAVDYTSIGCDWLLEPNPLKPLETIGTQKMVEKCRTNGTSVPSYLFNALERDWCRTQALNPEKVFLDLMPDTITNGLFLQMGRSVYDRTTKEFLACMYIGIDVSRVQDLLRMSLIQKEDQAMIIGEHHGKPIVISSSEDIHSYSTLGDDILEELFALVDYDSIWDPEEVSLSYRQFSKKATVHNGEYIVSFQPIPEIPSEYDESYRPSHFFVGLFYAKRFQTEFDNMDRIVETYKHDSTIFAIVMGVVGIVIAMSLISLMAYAITSPLTTMNKVAGDIVDNFGESKTEEKISCENDRLVIPLCTPKTEVMDVVREFNKMVNSFSGVSEAKSEKQKVDDVLNFFPARNAFFKLYKTRDDSNFQYKLLDENADMSSDGDEISYLNLGSNQNGPTEIFVRKEATKEPNATRSESKKTSRLFVWTLFLIVIPMLLILITISTVVTLTLISGFEKVQDNAMEVTMELARESTQTTVRLRAEYVSRLTEKSINDLSLLTRFTNWLLFGGLTMSDSFTQVSTVAEDCKGVTGDFSQCRRYQEEFMCDCKWQDPGFETTCTNYNESTRHSEVVYWISELSDDKNGDRSSTTFPNASYSPETTHWWNDTSELPGSQNEPVASGYSSSFDRLRAVSAIPFFTVLKNYVPGAKKRQKSRTIALGVGFEADGMFIHYGGCDTVGKNAAFSSWVSTDQNKAATFRPELCPVGKHGYDPRCRGWYHDGRDMALLNNNRLLHITAPYEFAHGHSIVYGQSATNAILHPSTGESVGQTLIDFESDKIFQALKSETETWGNGVPLLITTGSGYGDTVIGPGYSLGQAPINASNLLLQHDVECKRDTKCQKLNAKLDNIVERMKEGEDGMEFYFKRSKSRGKENEKVNVHYSPVFVNVANPIDSSDYTRGVQKQKVLVYSLAYLVNENETLNRVNVILENVRSYLRRGVGCLAAVIIIASAISIYMSHILATSFTATMKYLLGILRYINAHGGNQTSPPDDDNVRPSYETVVLSGTLEALYRIIRLANTAFFAGEHGSAYYVLRDALRLFRRLNNKKAIGVASNNIGNALLNIYQEMKLLGTNELYGLTLKDVVSQGIAHYGTAISLGEETYDAFYELQGWSPVCLNFMQHLANRYFNRGMFLLIIKDDHDDPNEIERVGLRDLQIANDMDLEVVAYSEEIGWGSNERVASRFNVNITRLKGYNILCNKGYKPDEHDWTIDEVMKDTINIFKKESKKPNSNLFLGMTHAGRLQELELRLMRYNVLKGDIETAAKIAVRMLIEDEYVFVDAMRQAISILIKYTHSDKVDTSFREKMMPILLEQEKSAQKMMEKFSQDLRSRYSDSISVATRDTARSTRSSRARGTSTFSLASKSVLSSLRASVFSSSALDRPLQGLEPLELSEIFVTMEDF